VTIVDWIIVIAAIGYAIGGFRNGAVIGLFSLVGFFGGAVVGAQLARPLGSHLAGGQAQVPVAIVCVLVVSMAGQLLAVWAAGHLRERITWRPAQHVDAAIGAGLGVIAVLLVAWMVAVPLASSPYPSLSSAVRRSVIVRGVDGVMPTPVRNVYSSLRQFIDRSGFPPVFGDLQTTRIVDVGPPDPRLLHSPGVNAARGSVFKIYAEAPQCNRGIEGSGFAYDDQHILTNAHVVAGTSDVAVVTKSGQLTAHVVLYDPRRDVAVLNVPGLHAPPLKFTPRPAGTNANAIVLGYPEDGPFDVRAARVRDREHIDGHDIYGHGTVEREIYSIRSTVRSGNSGGPLIAPDGTVLGMVFATALDSSDTGFVLTDAEIASDANAGRHATAAVSTQGCTPGS
jgi:S1-C subfamily serine protease